MDTSMAPNPIFMGQYLAQLFPNFTDQLQVTNAIKAIGAINEPAIESAIREAYNTACVAQQVEGQ